MRFVSLLAGLFVLLLLTPSPAVRAGGYDCPDCYDVYGRQVNIYLADAAFFPIDFTARDIFFNAGVPPAVRSNLALRERGAGQGAANTYSAATSGAAPASAGRRNLAGFSGLPAGAAPFVSRTCQRNFEAELRELRRGYMLAVLLEDASTDNAYPVRGYSEDAVVRVSTLSVRHETGEKVPESPITNALPSRGSLVNQAARIMGIHGCASCHTRGKHARGGIALYDENGLLLAREIDWLIVYRYVSAADNDGHCPPAPRKRLSKQEQETFKMLAGGN